MPTALWAGGLNRAPKSSWVRPDGRAKNGQRTRNTALTHAWLGIWLRWILPPLASGNRALGQKQKKIAHSGVYPLEGLRLEERAVKPDKAADRIVECSAGAYRGAFGILLNDTAARDVVQDASGKAMMRLDQLVDDEKFEGWFLRIVMRLALDTRMRGRKSVRPGKIDDIEPSPATIAVRNELHEALYAAIQDLPFKLQSVISLKYWGNYKYREIAGILQIPEGTVATLSYRGHMELRASLARRGVHDGTL